MEITGVQAVGARSLGSVTATVASPTTPSVVEVRDASAAGAGARGLGVEAVVFPRDGKPVDRRPVHLRKAQAAARYRSDDGSAR